MERHQIMERFWLALVCFWRILLGETLPVERLPRWVFPLAPPGIPLPIAGTATAVAPAPAPKPAPQAPPVAPAAPAPAAPVASPDRVREEGALLLLAHLQREGRLLDFLMDKIDGYQDAQIGAVVRQIHAGCKKAIVEHVAIEPVLPGAEESRVTLEKGYDARAVRLVGNVRGSPPFQGTLRHHGWRAKPTKPFGSADGDPTVIAPAEVEL